MIYEYLQSFKTKILLPPQDFLLPRAIRPKRDADSLSFDPSATKDYHSLNQNINFVIQQNPFEHVICKMASISFKPENDHWCK